MNHHATMINLLKTHFGDKEITGIEIGTGGGGLPAGIMLYCPNVINLITIDPYKHKDNVEFESSWPQERLDATKAEAARRLSVHKDKITMLHMTSEDAIKFVPKEVDFVHVDGDHTTEGINKDIELYSPLVKKGGIFSGHDYGQVLAVTQAVDKKWGDKVHTGGDFTFWVFV